MARYNTVLPSTTTTTTASVDTPSAGIFTKFTGTAPYTVTIGDPVMYNGSAQTFFNATSGIVTLSFSTIGSGKFVGPGIPGNATTQAMAANATLVCYSDGTTWAIVVNVGGPLSGTTLSATSTVTLSPASANVAISPSGTGTVTISPAGALTINPTTASNIDNTAIGVTTAAAGNFSSIGGTTRGSGLFTTLGANAAVTLSPANANVVMSPTGSGVVTISPATLGSIDNVAIGGSTRRSGAFTTLAANGLTTFTQGGQGTTATDAANAVNITGGLGVNGTIYVTSLVETSSIAFKENVSPITGAMDAILQLTGVTYDRKDNKKHETGLIAEEVYKFAPDLVAVDKDGKPYGIHYTKISAYLIECVKTLQAEIDQLKGKKKTKGNK
jgi:hypothetical protein